LTSDPDIDDTHTTTSDGRRRCTSCRREVHGRARAPYIRDVARRQDFEDLAADTHVLGGIAYPRVSIGQHLDRHPADLMVVTTHARTGFALAALGSEAARIIHRSPVQVLVQPVPTR
jgi:nucleotide-binding universal stress UspA family protein